VGALPGGGQADLAQHHGVVAQRGAHPRGLHGPTPERQHRRLRAAEQLEHELLLLRAERGLAVPVEEVLDRPLQPALELAVGVEVWQLQRGGGLAGERGLPRAHEPREDDHAGWVAPCPMRSR
jgi:hypothetical protein